MHEHKVRTLAGGTETETFTWVRPEASVEITNYRPGDDDCYSRGPWWSANIHINKGENAMTPEVDVFDGTEDHPGFVAIEVGAYARHVTIFLSPEQASELVSQLSAALYDHDISQEQP